jgi:hypothetical protein
MAIFLNQSTVQIKMQEDDLSVENNTLAFCYKSVVEFDEQEPRSLSQALEGDESQIWREAIANEVASLNKHQVWDSDPVLKTPGTNVIKTKFIFRKKDAGTENERYKARLVAQGFKQREGVDYEETFSGVVDKVSLRSVFHLIAANDMKCVKFDVPTAFLHARLEENIYISLPREIFEYPENHVFRLRRALYGLKQSPRAWQAQLASSLSSIGFSPNEKDPCVYTLLKDGVLAAICAIHVDDGLLGCKDQDISNKVCRTLVEIYNITIVPEPSSYLGIDIEWRRHSHTVVLTQKSYIVKLFQRFQSFGINPAKIPMSANTVMSKREAEEAISEMPFRELIGGLIYISCCTRSDVSFPVNRHAQHFSEPADRHFFSALKILGYLHATKELGLHLGGRSSLDIRVFVDADFAQDEDTRLSVTGNLIFLGNSLVSWTSKRQKLIATSSTEAEYLAVFYSMRDMQYVFQFFQSVFPADQLKVTLFQDNQSTIALIQNQSSKGRSKHFDVKLRAVHTALTQRQFQLEYLPSADMLADLLTKPVSRNILIKLRTKILQN